MLKITFANSGKRKRMVFFFRFVFVVYFFFTYVETSSALGKMAQNFDPCMAFTSFFFVPMPDVTRDLRFEMSFSKDPCLSLLISGVIMDNLSIITYFFMFRDNAF